MVSSEICFCAERDNYRSLENPTFIFPQYLAKESPVLYGWESEDALHLKYVPPFFHKGLAERFLVRLGRLSEKRGIWRKGILILHPQSPKTKALIQFDREAHEIYIQTRGQAAKKFYEEIRQTLDKLLDENSETKPSEKVRHFVSLEGVHFVEKTKLEDALDNEAKYVKSEDGQKIEVENLAELYDKAASQPLEGDPLREAAKKHTQPQEPKGPMEIKIFVSYCSADRELREFIVEELNTHLKNFEGFTFTLWDDTEIDLGTEWETTIEKAMAECQAALLLVSPKFAASKYITETELVEFFKKKKEGGFLLMPMLLRKYDFSRLEEVAKLNFFKTYHSEYGYNKPLLRNKLIPFDKLAEDESITDEKLNLYFNKLGEFIHTAVKNKFGQ